MSPAGGARFCSCGTRLASDNRTGRCSACRKKDRERLEHPPTVPAGFWDHADMGTALLSRHFGRVLRAYRCHPFHGIRPLAQDVVARWLGITQSQLSRTENGSPIRDLDRLIAWARLLDIPEHLLWFRLPADDPSKAQLRRSRRSAGALQALPAVAVPHLPRELAPVGVDDLAAMQSLRTADRQIGGGYLYATVASYLQHTIAPRLFGGSGDSDEHGVFVAAAGLTEMAGWMAHDAGRDALAEHHFQRALGMAQVGQDHQLGAAIYCSLSHLAHHNRQPEKAIGYAGQGHARLQAGRPHPGIEARLLAMQARGHAALRDQDRCAQQLRQAEQALKGQHHDLPSPWVSTFDEASLATEAARCFQQLGQLGTARRQAEQVVELRPRDRARSRAFAHLMLISILIAQGKPDEACGVAYDVLDATRALGSYLVVQQLEELDRLLAPYRRDRDIAEFLSHLGEELRERRWLSQWLPSMEPSGQGQAGTSTP
jgi:transcriptional regulator with XRE-family HTH domain